MKANLLAKWIFVGVLATLCFNSCDKLNGEGNNITVSLKVDSFRLMTIDIPCDIRIEYASNHELIINAQQNIVDNIFTEVKNYTLNLEFIHKVFEHSPISITFKTPDFLGYTIHNDCDVVVASKFNTAGRINTSITGTGSTQYLDTITCYDFRHEVSGTSSLNMAYLDCKNFNYVITGKADATVNGKAYTTKISTTGESRFYGFDFLSENVTLDIAGSSPATEIFVNKELKTTVNGSAIVRYKGYPHITNDSTATGSLELVDAN